MGLFDGFKHKKDQQSEPPFVVVANGAEAQGTEEGQEFAAQQEDHALEQVEAASTAQDNNANPVQNGETVSESATSPVSGDDNEPEGEDEATTIPEMPVAKNTPIKSYDEKAPVNHAIGETKIIAIINQKGGVAKTTSAFALSAGLAKRGYRVLMIDSDPQENLSQAAGIDLYNIPASTLSDVFKTEKGEPGADINETIINISENVDLIIGGIEFTSADLDYSGVTSREFMLQRALRRLNKEYDFCIIDCSPTLALITQNVLAITDKIVVPMTPEVAECFKHIITGRSRVKVEPIIDGYSGFLYLDKNDMPMVALHWEKYFQHVVEKYNSIYKVQLPKITPHVCRHTFCSNMAKSGMNPKTLQYVMGHADIGVTLNTYTHLSFEDAREEMTRLCANE